MEAPTELIALLGTSLDRVLGALGLEMGAIWLHPHSVVRGLPPEAAEIAQVAGQAGLSIPQAQAVPDWQRIGETHPDLAPLAGVMQRLGIGASIAVSLQHGGRAGGLAVAAPQPRAWSGTEIALVETVAHLLGMAINALEAEEKRRESEQRYRQLFDHIESDVTERKRMEEEVRRVNRALRVLSQGNEAVVRAADEATLLKEICCLLVQDGGYRLAWVGFAEQDGAKTVRPVAQAGFEEGYLETVTITWDDSETGRGPTGTAIRSGRPAVVKNMLTDPAYTPWREEATRRGYASSIALPLTAEGYTFGALNIYAPKPDAFAPEEVELLCRLADDLAFGIQALRTQKALRESEAKYRTLVEQAPDGIFLAGAQGRFVDVNPRGCALLGYTREEIRQLSIQDLIPPEDLAAQPVRYREMRAGETAVVERRLRRKDGSLVPVEISVKMLDNGLLQGIIRDVSTRKEMEEEIRRQANRAGALLRVASRLNAQLDLDRVLNVVCEEARAALRVPVAAVLLYDDRRDALNLAAGLGLPPELAGRVKPPPRYLYEEYVLKGDPVAVIPDLRAVPDRQVADLCTRYNLCTGVGAKMQRDGRLIGVVALATTGEVRRFSPEELTLLQGLADQAAQAITAAQLFEETRRRLKFVQALRNIDLAITGSFDLRVTFSVALDEITAQLGMDAAAILLLNPHTLMLEYAAWRGFRTGAVKPMRLRLGEGYAGRAALERRTIQIFYLPEAERDLVQAPLLAEEGFVTYFAVPLIAKGQIQGVLEVCHRSPVDPGAEWLQFLEALAGQAAIAIDNVALLDQLQRSHLELVLAYDSTIEGWARALDLRDKETEGHSQRVTEMTLRLARALGMKEEELAHVRRGALLHDIGKMGIPDSILLKPGPLDPEEWEIMRRHPQYAYEMLSPIAYLRPALDIPYCHHEKWDGTGYPRGLKSEQIPLAARIFAVVD
ncbi:MAG: GAF domain-containing protein, partial [Clostridia bacterium]|nr:GAF domain-containing protein [Clostridia bacterium]